MKCPSCGFVNPEKDDFCETCGASLDAAASSPRYLISNILNTPLKDIPFRISPIVKPSATLREVIRAMKEKKMGCLLVVDGKELVGIFTERDVLQKVASTEMDLNKTKIEEIMTTAPEVLSEEHTIAAALNKMSMGNYRHVPVQKSDGTFSSFSVKDALQFLF